MMPTPARRPRRAPPPPRRSPAILYAGIGAGAAIAVVVVAVLATRPSPKPAPAAEAPTTSSPKTSAPPSEPARPKSPLDRVLDDCAALVRDRQFKKAIDTLNEQPTRGIPETDKSRIEKELDSMKEQATRFVEERAKEAEGDAAQGLLQQAADRLKTGADMPLPVVVGAAYQRLRRAADTWLAAERAKARAKAESALAALAARYSSARPPADPDAAWKRVEGLLDSEKWIEAVEALTALAALPAWRERALAARARAHHAAGEFVGVLLDAQLLLESGQAVEAALAWLNHAVTRAPIDEAVLALYERVLEKHPAQPRVWESLCMLWTWRHDVERAAETYRRASARKVQFDGPALARITQYVQLRERGFPAGKPVFVDYAGPYEILTDATPDRARELAGRLESIAKEYAALFRLGVNPHFRFRVMFFSQESDYKRYLPDGGGMQGAIAYYSPGIKQLVIFDSPKEFLEIVRHEAYHQFLNYFVSDAPRWFNEGSASFSEMSLAGTAAFNPKYHGGAAHGLAQGFLPPLKKLLTMSAGEWVSNPGQWFFYCESWSFIYWLHRQGKGALMDEYLRLLILGHPPQAVHDRVFAPTLDELEKRWKASVRANRYEE